VTLDPARRTSTGNSWVALNRITDPSGVPSQILGQIKAEGSVYLLNANGIIFGGSAQVNVNSLIVSSLNLFSNDLPTSNNRFLTGGIGDLNTTNVATDSILLTTTTPNAGAVTIQSGAQITVGTQGFAVIAAPTVTNNGMITAPSGQVAMIAGIGVSYDYNYGSFNPYGPDGCAGQPDGYNNNATTMLRFANYGELTDANGNDITPVGTLTNNGLIYTPRGNITLLGGAVQQNGVAVATTGVQQPGSIIITRSRAR
jgi:filamentous hemagglutinin family protein